VFNLDQELFRALYFQSGHLSDDLLIKALAGVILAVKEALYV